jgi:putative ABC transport system permease protein
VDAPRYADVQRRLKEMPAVASVTGMDLIVQQFEEQSAEWMWVMTLIMTILAATIAVGVVYNNARVALSMRSRDLASLRVLGFTRAEISAILLGELAVQLVLAIPIGLWVGTYLSNAIMETVDPEQYRFPATISARTYAFAVVVALASGFVSALLVRRKLDHLDLIGVLKTRD